MVPAWPNSHIDELLPFADPVEDVKAQGVATDAYIIFMVDSVKS